MRIFLLFLIIAACAQTSRTLKVPPPPRVSEAQVGECKDYERQVLAAALEKDETFTQDELEARKYLSSFDITKGYPVAKAALVQNILSDCSEERVQDFDREYKRLNACTLTYAEMGFFQALGSALRKYRWPTELKLEGKRVALDYVRFYAEGRFPLINRLVALSVLDELSVNGQVNEKLHSEIKQHMHDARSYVEGLRQKLDGDPALSCRSLDLIREELDYSQKVAAIIQDLLKRI